MRGIKIEVVIDEEGVIQEVTENSGDLKYAPELEGKTMVGSRIAIINHCCWLPGPDGIWRCVPC